MAWPREKQSCAGSAPAPPVSTVAALSAWWHGQSEVSQPWAVEQPNNRSLLNVILLLSLASLVGTLAFNGLRNKERFLEAWGVNARKVHRTIKEVDRKMFHLATLLVPLIHQLLLNVGWTNEDCVSLCWAITITGWTADISRVYGPGWIQRNWPMQRILREKEKNQLTGSCYLSLGCTLTMAISPPSITMASILFLILGDLSAAIVGVSFGGETVSLKLGRAGKKSAEGSMAMLFVCFCIGCVTFWNVELREYPVRAPPLRRLAPLHRPLASPCAALCRLAPPCAALCCLAVFSSCARSSHSLTGRDWRHRRDAHRAHRAVWDQRQPHDPNLLFDRAAVRLLAYLDLQHCGRQRSHARQRDLSQDRCSSSLRLVLALV